MQENWDAAGLDWPQARQKTVVLSGKRYVRGVRAARAAQAKHVLWGPDALEQWSQACQPAKQNGSPQAVSVKVLAVSHPVQNTTMADEVSDWAAMNSS
jgi:hypothetical protein